MTDNKNSNQLEEKKNSEVESKEEVQSISEKGNWYVIHTHTNYEARTKKALEQRIKTLGVADKIFEVVIPTREIVVVRRGKKIKKVENVFPGYLLVRMILDDQSWLVVRTTEGVTGFVGTGVKPTPVSEKEIQAIMQFVKQEQPKFKTSFSIGEAVKITEGPFADFLGTIDKIDEERGKVRVLVSIFDRETPVELDFFQITKI